MSYQASHRYAQALFEVCGQTKMLDNVRGDLLSISEAINASQDLGDFIDNPVIPKLKQEEAINKLFKKKLSPTTFKFLLFLVQKGRLNLIKNICGLFDKLYLEAKKIAKVKIFSSAPLNAHQLTTLKQHLKSKLKKSIHAEVEVDTDMIGGIKVRIGDEIHDYSIRSQLESFRQNIAKVA